MYMQMYKQWQCIRDVEVKIDIGSLYFIACMRTDNHSTVHNNGAIFFMFFVYDFM